MNVTEFWGRTDRSGECWLWTGAGHTRGYGTVRYGGHTVLTHRLAWELTNGPATDGLMVLHRCDVRRCIRPDHLFLGTGRDNSLDMLKKERQTCARLNADKVTAIRKDSRPHRVIAAAYGVRPSTIKAVLNGQNWKWVNG